jgi:hypothetical protein
LNQGEKKPAMPPRIGGITYFVMNSTSIFKELATPRR